MQRVKRTTAVALLPADPGGGEPGYFAAPNPGGGVPATVPGYEWYNNVQEELISIIAAAGIALDGTNRAQLLAALRAAGVFQTAEPGDNTTKVATTAFVHAAIAGFITSLGSSGYQKFPSGLIVQWGLNVNGVLLDPKMFPIAFPNALFGIVGSVKTSGFIFSIYEQSNTQFTPHMVDFNGTGGSNYYWYIAIGY